jgi:hypothetical protein
MQEARTTVLRRFANVMHARLEQNDHRVGWHTTGAQGLIDRALSNLTRAQRGLQKGAPLSDIRRDLANCGNYCAFVADVIGALAYTDKED